MSVGKPGRGSDQFPLRLPDGLRDQIKERAEANGRSMNAEIVAAIEGALDQPDLNAAQLRSLLDEERDAADRAVGVVQAQFDLIDRYKAVLDTAGGQVYQQAGIIESLCTIILSLGASDEVIEMAKKISHAAHKERIKFEEKDTLRKGRSEASGLQDIISTADELLRPSKE